MIMTRLPRKSPATYTLEAFVARPTKGGDQGRRASSLQMKITIFREQQVYYELTVKLSASSSFGRRQIAHHRAEILPRRNYLEFAREWILSFMQRCTLELFVFSSLCVCTLVNIFLPRGAIEFGSCPIDFPYFSSSIIVGRLIFSKRIGDWKSHVLLKTAAAWFIYLKMTRNFTMKYDTHLSRIETDTSV